MSVLTSTFGLWGIGQSQKEELKHQPPSRARGDSTDLTPKEIPEKRHFEQLCESSSGWETQLEKDGFRAEIKNDADENRFYGRGSTTVNCSCDKMYDMFCNTKLAERIDQNCKIDVLSHDPHEALSDAPIHSTATLPVDHELGKKGGVDEHELSDSAKQDHLEEQPETETAFDPLASLDLDLGVGKTLGVQPQLLNLPQLQQQNKSSEFLSRFATRCVFNAFWPIAPREFLTSTFVLKGKDGSCVSVSYADKWLLEKYPTVHPNCVRGDSPIAAYKCVPIDGEADKCALTYVFSFDPKGWIPKYLADRHTIHGCYQVLKLRNLIDADNAAKAPKQKSENEELLS